MAHLKWWQRGVIYREFTPALFRTQITTVSAIFKGFIDRLDYLVDLGR